MFCHKFSHRDISVPVLAARLPGGRFSIFLICLLIVCSIFAAGCSSGSSAGSTKAADDTAVLTPAVRIPTADGTETIGNETVTVDISNTSNGYIMASYHGTAAQVNIQLTGPDGVTYLYFISEKDTYTAMPLSSGDGSYIIDIYEQMDGDMYSNIMR